MRCSALTAQALLSLLLAWPSGNVAAPWLGVVLLFTASSLGQMVNPGFEQELKGWRSAHAGTDDPDAAYAVVATRAHSGKHCLAYSKSRGVTRNHHLDQIVDVEPDTPYTLSAWVRCETGLRPLLSVESMSWKPIAESAAEAGSDWQQLRVCFGSGENRQVRIIWYGGSRGRRYEGYPGRAWLDDVALRAATPAEARILEERRRTNTSDWFEFPLRWDDVEPAAALQFAGMHDAPAGKHGFSHVRGGHFVFQDGTRTRFWGVCICGRSAFPTHAQADVITERLAKCGVNLVRLHALEVEIFDSAYDDSCHLSAERLDRLDYFVSRLKARGIYLFMDWRTAWRTRQGDGLAPRWLYHWAMIDERFVELNETYARLLFLHRNPYTGTRYVDEPAIVAVEIVNEKDVFSVFAWQRHRDDPDIERLKQALKPRWNRWLLERYTSNARLAEVWTDADGNCALRSEEDPAQGTVGIPLPAHNLGPWDRAFDPGTAVARGSDALLFLSELQTDYFGRMRAFLRELGVRVPISGTNWHMQIRPNAQSNASLDFTENHAYWDHANPWPPGRDKLTRGRNAPMLRSDPASGAGGIIDKLCRVRVPGKPFVVTEWNFDSPNEYRCEGPIEMAAYGALQDWDGIICYCFYGGWGHAWDQVGDADELGLYLGSEELFNDPALLCQFPVAAAVFVRGDVRPATVTVDVGYSRVDTFFAQGGQGSETRHLAFLPFLHRVRHCYFDEQYAGDADVVVASGLSAFGNYASAAHALLHSDNPSADLYRGRLGRQQLSRRLYPDLRCRAVDRAQIEFNDAAWPETAATIGLAPGIELASIPAGASALGVDPAQGIALGFVNDRHCVVPHASALRQVDERWFQRVFQSAMARWGLLSTTQRELLSEPERSHSLVSDTGELCWDSRQGLVTIDTPRTQGVVGFADGQRIELADVVLQCRTRYCSVLVSSLSTRPIRSAARLLITAVARAENSGQEWSAGRTTIAAEHRGRAPVLVEPVNASVILHRQDSWTGRCVLRPLDSTGRPQAEQVLAPAAGRVRIELNAEQRTVFYALEFQTD